MFVDSHCHLDYPEFAPAMEKIREDMNLARVERALLISTKLETFDRVHDLAMAYDNFWCSLGVHPDEDTVQEPTEQDLLSRIRPKVVAIGETGLDYYRLNGRSLDEMQWQRERFRRHIRVAQSVRLPMVIHTRNASEDTLRILKEEGEDQGAKSVGGVFHCFTENLSVAQRAVEMGFYISFSGIVTFKNAKELKEVAQWVPLDRMLIETDSPYLAPTPHRGKVNNPSYVALVAEEIARLRNMDVQEIGLASTQNFDRLFSLAH